MTPRAEPKRSPGRRASDGSTNVQRVTITLTEEDRENLRKLGGSPWVRAQIRAASTHRMRATNNQR